MAASGVVSDTIRINGFARGGQNDFVPYEEEDPDTIRVLPRNDRKRRRSDSGVHFDERFEGPPANSTDLQEKACAAAETAVNSFHSSSGKMQKMSPPASNGCIDRDLGAAVNQPLIEADEMVLLPLTALKALQNEITELRSTVVSFKEDTRKHFDSHEDALKARLAFTEVETESLDDDDNCSPQALQKDRAARRIAVDRVRRLARENHSGKEQAHLEFMADIVGVEHKSKLPIRHGIRLIPDPELLAYARQRLLENYVARLWRHTYEGSFAKLDFVALGQDVERLYGCDKSRTSCSCGCSAAHNLSNTCDDRNHRPRPRVAEI